MATATERDAARRREILAAAEQCFFTFGFAKTSIDDIARAAGVSRPLLYRKYKNKEAIFQSIYDQVFTSALANAAKITSGSKRERLAQYCQIVCVDTYALIADTPVAREFWTICEEILPEILDDHDRKWKKLLATVLPKSDVEPFSLAIEGQWSDGPTAAVFAKRLRVLIERFTSK
ncbi:MAG: TetR/AcrR family transcriptional regulator [Kofleriaceae bacterium]